MVSIGAAAVAAIFHCTFCRGAALFQVVEREGLAMTPLDHFVTEGNVEIFLSKLRVTVDPAERDSILRLLIVEEDRMGRTAEHLDNGERRIADGRDRLRQHRQTIVELEQAGLSTEKAVFQLEPMERTQALFEAHCRHLRQALARSGL